MFHEFFLAKYRDFCFKPKYQLVCLNEFQSKLFSSEKVCEYFEDSHTIFYQVIFVSDQLSDRKLKERIILIVRYGQVKKHWNEGISNIVKSRLILIPNLLVISVALCHFLSLVGNLSDFVGNVHKNTGVE